MTAIVAITDGKTVHMGGDSAGVAGLRLGVRKDPKVFVVGEFLIGYTSSFRMGQLLRYWLAPPKPAEKHDAMGYMVCSFIPAVRQVLKDHGYMRVDSNVETGGDFLVGWRGNLFTVFCDLQVAEHKESFMAVGCGSDVALGSLHTTKSIKPAMTPKKRILAALEAAEAFSAGVRRPFTVLSK